MIKLIDLISIYQNDATICKLVSQFANGTNSHAYIICGTDSINALNVANYLSMVAVCDSHTACQNCTNCNKAIDNVHIDIVSVPQGDKVNISVDDIGQLTNDVNIGAYESSTKAYILNATKVNQMDIWQNKMLKTLEEPPKNVVFFIVCNSTASLLNTIVSRCQVININPLSVNSIEQLLATDNVNAKEILVASRLCEGNLSKAYQLLEKNCTSLLTQLFDILSHLSSSKDCAYVSTKLLKHKENLNLVLDLLNAIYRDIAVINTSNDNLLLKDFKDDILSLSNISPLTASLIIDCINDARFKLSSSCNVTMVVDSLVLEILEVVYKCRKL